MSTLSKLEQLFYSTEEKNRLLAFELAESQGNYETFVNQLYEEWETFPHFVSELEHTKVYFEELKEDQPDYIFPTGIAFKKESLLLFAQSYFYPEMYLSGRYQSKLSEFPRVILNCTFLQTLDLSLNELTTLPDDIDRLQQLRAIDLSLNFNLKSLPESFGNLTQLEKIGLHGCEWIFSVRKFEQEDPAQDTHSNKLPNWFRKLKNLKDLDFGNLALEEFPDWIDELTQLESISIHSGWGSYPTLEIPSSFTNLAHLKHIHIGSYTTYIPEDIDRLTNLESLVLQPILNAPANIRLLKNLKRLDFSYFANDYHMELEQYGIKGDLYSTGVPEGLSRLKLYGWEWLKEMTWLQEFTFVHIEPYAFTDLEKEELATALPNCTFIYED